MDTIRRNEYRGHDHVMVFWYSAPTWTSLTRAMWGGGPMKFDEEEIQMAWHAARHERSASQKRGKTGTKDDSLSEWCRHVRHPLDLT